jgi:hypothetical protein
VQDHGAKLRSSRPDCREDVIERFNAEHHKVPAGQT